MYVCCCKAVTDRQIADLVRSGTIKTWKGLVKQTCVATQCGICARTAKACFDKAALTDPDCHQPQQKKAST